MRGGSEEGRRRRGGRVQRKLASFSTLLGRSAEKEIKRSDLVRSFNLVIQH
jgi:hypothetical protein